MALAESVSAADATCNLWQTCNIHSSIKPDDSGVQPAITTKCTDGGDVTYPFFCKGDDWQEGDPDDEKCYPWAPQKMGDVGLSDLNTACPFYDDDELLCCNPDTAAIMGKF